MHANIAENVNEDLPLTQHFTIQFSTYYNLLIGKRVQLHRCLDPSFFETSDNCLVLCFRISEKEPNEGHEISTDFDESYFFTQEIDVGLKKGGKASAKTKKNGKRAGKQTEEDKIAKVNE